MGRPYWVRAGTDICYYKNHYRRTVPPSSGTGPQAAKSHYTASFCIRFSYSGDVCYLAYHYPYTYTTMQVRAFTLTSVLKQFSTSFPLSLMSPLLRRNSLNDSRHFAKLLGSPLFDILL